MQKLESVNDKAIYVAFDGMLKMVTSTRLVQKAVEKRVNKILDVLPRKKDSIEHVMIPLAVLERMSSVHPETPEHLPKI